MECWFDPPCQDECAHITFSTGSTPFLVHHLPLVDLNCGKQLTVNDLKTRYGIRIKLKVKQNVS